MGNVIKINTGLINIENPSNADAEYLLVAVSAENHLQHCS
jgi:hypothetical protein